MARAARREGVDDGREMVAHQLRQVADRFRHDHPELARALTAAAGEIEAGSSIHRMWRQVSDAYAPPPVPAEAVTEPEPEPEDRPCTCGHQYDDHWDVWGGGVVAKGARCTRCHGCNIFRAAPNTQAVASDG